MDAIIHGSISFLALCTSRLNRPDLTGASTSNAQILEQRGGRSRALALARGQFLHGKAALRVRHLHVERQALFVGHAQQQQADGVGDGQPHRLQGGGSLVSVSIRERTMLSAAMTALIANVVLL